MNNCQSNSGRLSDLSTRSNLPTLIGGLVLAVASLAVCRAEEPAPSADEEKHPLAPVLRLARDSREAAEQLDDYQAVFFKRERVEGRLSTQKMYLKLRQKPFSVYLRYLKPHAGREVLYVQGRNNGRLLAHESGLKSLAGTVAIAPNSPKAMEGNRYPITRIGLVKMVDGVIEQWKSETQFDEIDVTYYPNAKLGEMKCRVIETSHPRPRREASFHTTRLYIWKKTNLPIRVEQYAFPRRNGGKPPLVEQYTYYNIQTDVELTDRDFNTENPEYDF